MAYRALLRCARARADRYCSGMAGRSRATAVAGMLVFALSSACALAAGGEPGFTGHGTKLVSPGAFAFGSAVAVSGDGKTLLASAEEGRIEALALSGDRWASQGALRIPGYSGRGGNCSLGLSGSGDLAAVATGDAVEMFARKSSHWSRVAVIKSRDPLAAVTAECVALSADGATVVSSSSVGYALVFVRSGKAWRQQTSLKPTTDTTADFGTSVAISANGHVVAVGGPRDAGGDPTEPQPTDVGAWVFARSGSSWKQRRGSSAGPARATSSRNDQARRSTRTCRAGWPCRATAGRPRSAAAAAWAASPSPRSRLTAGRRWGRT